MTEYLSDETQEMLAVVDKYEDGDINLEEAVRLIQSFSSIKAQRIREILNGVERENLLKFPEGNF
jgi:Ca2+-binding EF-hand superfamily protein